MEHSVYQISLEIQKEASQGFLKMKKTDSARQIRAVLTDGGRPYQIADGCTASFRAVNTSGTVYSRSCDIEYNMIIYTVSPGVLSEAGELTCEFHLFGADGKQITCPRFTIIVSDQVVDDDEAISDEEMNELAQLVAQTVTATAAAYDAVEDLRTAVANGEFNGEKGDPGDTPVAGEDYFTEDDKDEFTEDIKADLDFAMIQPKASGTAITLTDSSDQPFRSFEISGGTEGEVVNIEVSGKNFFNIAKVASTDTVEGNKMTITAGGLSHDIYTGHSSGSAAVNSNILHKLPYLPAGQYTLSYIRENDAGFMRLYKVAQDGAVKVITSGDGSGTGSHWVYQFTLDEDSHITLRRSNSGTCIVSNLQIERGNVATDYQPYYEPQKVTVEATGDKVDVLAQHPELHSYFHTTVVSNDKDIPMDVEYTADTKTYIDNKFAQLAEAVVCN